MHPILLHIGNFELASYGLMSALGYAAASFYLWPRIKKVNMDTDTFWNLIFIVFMGALVGAKLLFIIVSWPELGATLAEKLANIIKDFRYGFVFFGGMIVSVGGAVWYIRRKKLPLLKTADFLIVGLPLGHALGRIGCFLAGCCYGKPTALPWGVRFTDAHALVPSHLLGVPLHPTQLYEAALNLVLFMILHFAYKKPHKDGKILAEYILCYGLMRFGIEFLRGDYNALVLGVLKSAQVTSVVAFTIAAGIFIWLSWRRKRGK